ncbi:336_t:CDS:2, partial [Funneliformis mosseae]
MNGPLFIWNNIKVHCIRNIETDAEWTRILQDSNEMVKKKTRGVTKGNIPKSPNLKTILHLQNEAPSDTTAETNCKSLRLAAVIESKRGLSVWNISLNDHPPGRAKDGIKK